MLLPGRLSSIMSTIQSGVAKGGTLSTIQARNDLGRAAFSTLAILVLAACGGGSSSSGGGPCSGHLPVGGIAPFTRPHRRPRPACYSACTASTPPLKRHRRV